MKVFISSVRRGLEQERDSLPGLFRAVGHDPVRFEDFTAQSVPSREACLRGVAESDVYLLLLGPHYGTVFPETGRSPTHEEYTAAMAEGIPRLVFRKAGAEFDASQKSFIDEIEAYGTGVFRESFTDAVDLQAKVVEALNNLPPAPLVWHPLHRVVEVTWRSSWSSSTLHPYSRAELCVHAVPVEPALRSRRQLRDLPEAMAGRLRSLNAVATPEPIDARADETCAIVEVHERSDAGWNQVDQGGLLGCRIDANGQRSAWERLPSDSMGVILDRNDLGERIASILRVLGGIAPPDAETYAIALELATTPLTTVGSVARLGQRTSATGLAMSDHVFRVEPDESVTLAAFDAGADDVAAVLADQVIDEFTG